MKLIICRQVSWSFVWFATSGFLWCFEAIVSYVVSVVVNF